MLEANANVTHRLSAEMELAANRAADTRELAEREGVHDSYIRRLIPLAFLPPRIVDTSRSGPQPVELTAERLTRHWVCHSSGPSRSKRSASVLGGLTRQDRGDRE